MNNPLVEIKLDQVTVPFLVRPIGITRNDKAVIFNNGWAYGSRLVYEADSRKLYFELESNTILIHGTYQPTKVTRLEDGVMVRVRNGSPVIVFWDWDGVSTPQKVKAFPTTFKYPKPLLPLGKQRVFAMSALEHTTIDLPTKKIYFMFEKHFELKQVLP